MPNEWLYLQRSYWIFQTSGAEATSLIFLVKHPWTLVSRINDVKIFFFFSNNKVKEVEQYTYLRRHRFLTQDQNVSESQTVPSTDATIILFCRTEKKCHFNLLFQRLKDKAHLIDCLNKVLLNNHLFKNCIICIILSDIQSQINEIVSKGFNLRVWFCFAYICKNFASQSWMCKLFKIWVN